MYAVVQGDQKASVNLTITVKKHAKYNVLNSFSYLT